MGLLDCGDASRPTCPPIRATCSAGAVSSTMTSWLHSVAAPDRPPLRFLWNRCMRRASLVCICSSSAFIRSREMLGLCCCSTGSIYLSSMSVLLIGGPGGGAGPRGGRHCCYWRRRTTGGARKRLSSRCRRADPASARWRRFPATANRRKSHRERYRLLASPPLPRRH